MVVYGDPSHPESLGAFASKLRRDLAPGGEFSFDSLRAFLVRAGQLEQAVFDQSTSEGKAVITTSSPTDIRVGTSTGGAETCRHLSMIFTDVIAEAFLNARRTDRPRPVDKTPDLPDADQLLKFKVPEGFAFYALYPEAYAAATERWMRDHPGARDQRIRVIGIRSIGTTLSAVICATLRQAGWRADRRTARPSGHPFDRKTDLSGAHLGGADWWFIADEGPGLSGSSIASVATALVERGVAPDRIVFFPGHANGPGSEASEETLRWWKSTPVYVEPQSEEAIRRLLEAETEKRLGASVVKTENLSGGRWRSALRDSPVAPTHFERTKYKVTTDSGEALLWKFVGFWDQAAIGGFRANPWIEGTPMTRSDVTPARVDALAKYLRNSARPWAEPDDREEARRRLIEMAVANLGEDVRLPMQRAAPDLGERQFADGRMALYEWIVTPSGAIHKVDREGNVPDHSIVGRQSLLWDVAGAIVEWDLTEDFADRVQADREVLPFYLIAYGAFKFGQLSFCASIATGPERKGLEAEAQRYRDSSLDYLTRIIHAYSPR